MPRVHYARTVVMPKCGADAVNVVEYEECSQLFQPVVSQEAQASSSSLRVGPYMGNRDIIYADYLERHAPDGVSVPQIRCY